MNLETEWMQRYGASNGQIRKGLYVTPYSLEEEYLPFEDLSWDEGAQAPSYVFSQWLAEEGTFLFLTVWERIHNRQFEEEAWRTLQTEIEERGTVSARRLCERISPAGIRYRHADGIFLHPSLAWEFRVWRSSHPVRRLNSWESCYRAAVGYHLEYGHLLPARDSMYGGICLGNWVRTQRERYQSGRLGIEKIRLLVRLDMVWNYRSFHWTRMLEAARIFRKEQGHLIIPPGQTAVFPDGQFDLYNWLQDKRVHRKKLTVSDRQSLEELGVVWNRNEKDWKAAWERGYEQAAVFYGKQRNLKVQEKYIDEDGYYLGVWIRHQRDNNAQGKLSAEQIRRLNNIGMLWEAQQRIQTSFDEQALFFYMRQLFPDARSRDRKFAGCELDVFLPSLKVGIEYDGPRFHPLKKDLKKNEKCRGKVFLIRVRHHSLPVIGDSGPDVYYIRLSASNDIQEAVENILLLLRERFGVAKSLEVDLDRDRQAIYEQLASYGDTLWNGKLADAAVYYKEHGDIDVPYGYMVKGYDLGSWISEQRKAYGQNRLCAFRSSALNALGMKWRYKEENWLRMYGLMKEYMLSHEGRRPLRNGGAQERRLFYWLNDQIKYYRKGKLSGDKTVLLQELGVTTEYRAELYFDGMCEKLLLFKARYGHCIVPLEEGRGELQPLGLWAQRMRLQMASNCLPKERTDRLIQIGLPDNNQDAKFWRRLALAAEYREENGDLLIPQNTVRAGCRLGKWINSLRVRYRNDDLAAWQTEALEKLGMVWKIERNLPIIP